MIIVLVGIRKLFLVIAYLVITVPNIFVVVIMQTVLIRFLSCVVALTSSDRYGCQNILHFVRFCKYFHVFLVVFYLRIETGGICDRSIFKKMYRFHIWH